VAFNLDFMEDPFQQLRHMGVVQQVFRRGRRTDVSGGRAKVYFDSDQFALRNTLFCRLAAAHSYQVPGQHHLEKPAKPRVGSVYGHLPQLLLAQENISKETLREILGFITGTSKLTQTAVYESPVLPHQTIGRYGILLRG